MRVNGDAWRAVYGQSTEYDVLADLWELQALRAGVKQSKAKYPRTPKHQKRRARRAQLSKGR